MERFNQIQRASGLPEFVSSLISKAEDAKQTETQKKDNSEKKPKKKKAKLHQAIMVDDKPVSWRKFLDHRKPELAEKAKAWRKQSQAEAQAAKKAIEEGKLDIPACLRPEATATNGYGITLIGLRNGEPVFEQTYNAGVAAAMGTDQLWPGGGSGLELSGSNYKIGMWDAVHVFPHQEYITRFSNMDSGQKISYKYNVHSTQVAGTLIAAGSSDRKAKGMAFNAHLDAYSHKEDEFAEMALAASGTNAIKISNHSHGPPLGWEWIGYWHWTGGAEDEDCRFGFYSPDRSRVVDEIAYNAPEYLSVWAAGNNSDDGPGNSSGPENDGGRERYDNISPFGCAKNNLTVGAIEKATDGSIIWADFSSCGPTDDGRIKPDVVAPGTDIWTTSWKETPLGLGKYKYSSSYTTEQGTSFSAPAVAGSLLLIQQLHDTLFETNRLCLSSTLKVIAIHTADDDSTWEGPDFRYGWGAFNALAAATLVTNDVASEVHAHLKEFYLPNGEQIEFPVWATNSMPLKVTIAWIDPPGPELPEVLNTNALVLVNDLDLRLISPSGVTNFPWTLDPEYPSMAAVNTNDNFRDNVEQVYIPEPENGLYTVEVSHKGTLTNGCQTLSMALSGNEPVGRKEFLIDRINVTSTTNTLQWSAVPGAFYEVFAQNSLRENMWTNSVAEVNALSTNVVLNLTTNETCNTAFYRIKETF